MAIEEESEKKILKIKKCVIHSISGNSVNIVKDEGQEIDPPSPLPPQEVEHTVTFDANGGSPEIIIIKVDPNGKIRTLPEPYERTGYEFQGWYPSPEGNGQCLTTSTIIDSDRTYYALWLSQTCYIVYDAQGGTSWESTAVPYMSEVEELSNATRPGYDFLGWFTEPNGGTQITNGYVMTNLDGMTVYAHWRKIDEGGEEEPEPTPQTVTIELDLNGGHVGSETSIPPFEVPIGDILINHFPLVFYAGHSFDGWWHGSQKLENNSIATEDTIYQAHWIENGSEGGESGEGGGSGDDELHEGEVYIDPSQIEWPSEEVQSMLDDPEVLQEFAQVEAEDPEETIEEDESEYPYDPSNISSEYTHVNDLSQFAMNIPLGNSWANFGVAGDPDMEIPNPEIDLSQNDNDILENL